MNVTNELMDNQEGQNILPGLKALMRDLLKESIGELTVQISELTAKIGELADAGKRLESRMDDMDNGLKIVSNDVKRLESRIDDMDGDLKAVSNDMKHLDTKLSNDMKLLDTKLSNDMKLLDTKFSMAQNNIQNYAVKMQNGFNDIDKKFEEVERRSKAKESFPLPPYGSSPDQARVVSSGSVSKPKWRKGSIFG